MNARINVQDGVFPPGDKYSIFQCLVDVVNNKKSVEDLRRCVKKNKAIALETTANLEKIPLHYTATECDFMLANNTTPIQLAYLLRRPDLFALLAEEGADLYGSFSYQLFGAGDYFDRTSQASGTLFSNMCNTIAEGLEFRDDYVKQREKPPKLLRSSEMQHALFYAYVQRDLIDSAVHMIFHDYKFYLYVAKSKPMPLSAAMIGRDVFSSAPTPQDMQEKLSEILTNPNIATKLEEKLKARIPVFQREYYLEDNAKEFFIKAAKDYQEAAQLVALTLGRKLEAASAQGMFSDSQARTGANTGMPIMNLKH